MTKTYAEPSPAQFEAIEGNTRLLTEGFTELSGESLTPGRAGGSFGAGVIDGQPGVVFLDGVIDRQRERGDEAPRERLADMARCYLGASLIAEAGGHWVQDPEYGLGVEILPDLVAFPFAKAAKHFANGREDSVLSFFDVTTALAADKRRKAGPG